MAGIVERKRARRHRAGRAADGGLRFDDEAGAQAALTEMVSRRQAGRARRRGSGHRPSSHLDERHTAPDP